MADYSNISFRNNGKLKLHQMDPNLNEAAQDLGCTPVQAFFKVVIHEITPGIISGALMSFTMSLDDFVISYFVYGPKFVTLPVEIYNYTKKPLHPKIYALFTLLFAVILIVMVVMNLMQLRHDRQNDVGQAEGDVRYKQRRKAEDVVYLQHRTDEGKEQRQRNAGDDLGVRHGDVRDAHGQLAQLGTHGVYADRRRRTQNGRNGGSDDGDYHRV